MSRSTISLTAAAASALVAAAIVALPAPGDNGKSGDDGVASYATCLRSHGLAGAPSDSPMALKQWLAAKEQADPATVKKAVTACAPPDAKPKFAERRELSIADVGKLVACMRDNGLDAPSDPVALKRWLAQHESSDPATVDGVMRTCKIALSPQAPAKPVKPAGCGDDPVKPGDPATKPDAPEQPAD